MRILPLCAALAFLCAAAACDDGADPALEEEKAKSAVFLAAAAKENGATQTASGMVIRTLSAGHGTYPAADDEVVVNYTGRLADGKVFDTSANRGPAKFRLTQLIRCWTEGLTQMREGETAVLTCPSDLAYGDHGHPGTIPGGAALQFEIELKEIVRAGE